MVKYQVGDIVTLSKQGFEELKNEELPITQRLFLTRLINFGGKISKIYNDKIEAEIVMKELDNASQLIIDRNYVEKK